MMEHYPDGWLDLADAIVARAAEDYAIAFMGGNIKNKTPEDVMTELEKWVHSDYYLLLTKVDGDWLLKNVKIRELETVLTAYKTAFETGNHPRFELKIRTPRGQKNIDLVVPPRLMDTFMEVLTTQIKDLEKELKELKSNGNR